MKATLIRWLGGVTKEKCELLETELRSERELLNRANALIDNLDPRKFCTKTPGCCMEEGHGMDCREWHGLTFGTGRRKERARMRQEQLGVSQPSPETPDAPTEAAETQETAEETVRQ